MVEFCSILNWNYITVCFYCFSCSMLQISLNWFICLVIFHSQFSLHFAFFLIVLTPDLIIPLEQDMPFLLSIAFRRRVSMHVWRLPVSMMLPLLFNFHRVDPNFMPEKVWTIPITVRQLQEQCRERFTYGPWRNNMVSPWSFIPTIVPKSYFPG